MVVIFDCCLLMRCWRFDYVTVVAGPKNVLMKDGECRVETAWIYAMLLNLLKILINALVRRIGIIQHRGQRMVGHQHKCVRIIRGLVVVEMPLPFRLRCRPFP